MSKSLGVNFEKAVRTLAQYIPPSDESYKKPILFHGIRVGVYLYENGYSENVVLAGVLHDAIEWAGVSEKLLRDEFGDNVVKLILASTKDDSITDSVNRNNELIKRCVENGQDALIVKAADIIDSFKWYAIRNNKDELENHCVKNAKTIFEFKPESFDDKIFDELKKWLGKFSD